MDLASLLFGKDSWTYLSGEGPRFLISILFSMICGLVLGYERERKEKPAGLRTLTLISMGATVFVFAAQTISGPGVDPGRVAAQIITGVGFIGGGAIYRAEGFVQGVTTAATIWVAAAVGLLSGIGHYILAVSFTVITYFVLVLVPYVETLLSIKNHSDFVKITLTPEGQRKGWVYLKDLFEKQGATVEVSSQKDILWVRMYMASVAARQPLLECSRSLSVEKIEFGQKPQPSSN